MKNKIQFFCGIGIIILLSLMGCESSYQQNQMRIAYSLLNEIPDSSLSVLNKFDYRLLPESDKAYYALVHTIAQDKSGWDVDNDSLLRYAKSYYDEQPSDTLYAKYCYYLGKYYHLNEEFKLAEDYLNQSIRKAEKDKDYYTQYLAWNRLSKSLKFTSPDQAIIAAKKAYQIYTDHYADHLTNKVYLLISIGDSYGMTSEIDSTIFYYIKALELSESMKDKELMSASHQSLALVYQQMHEFEKSFQHAKEAWNITDTHEESLKYVLARAYMGVDSLRQCSDLLEELIDSDSSMKFSAYLLKTYCALRSANNPIIENYVDSTIYYSEKNHNDILAERTDYYKDKLQLQDENKLIQLKVKYQRFAIFLLVMLITVSAAFLSLLYKSKENKRKQKMEMLALQQKAREDMLLLQQQNSDNQIKYMREYLLAKVHFQEELDEFKKRSENHIDLDENTWSEIERFLNACENGFVSRLHETYPKLTKDDLRFCMLLRLDFSIHDLGKVYHLVDVSVKQKQYKFKAKLNLDDSKQSLRDYLQSF